MPSWSELIAAFGHVDSAEGLSARVSKQALRGSRWLVGLSETQVCSFATPCHHTADYCARGPGIDLLRIREAELEGAQSLSRGFLETYTLELLGELQALYPPAPEPASSTLEGRVRSRSPPRNGISLLSADNTLLSGRPLPPNPPLKPYLVHKALAVHHDCIRSRKPGRQRGMRRTRI